MNPIIDSDGTKRWFINGKCHRDNDKPAIIYKNGRQEWNINGECHRLYKPAVIYADGRQEWNINGNDITKEVIEFIKEHDLPDWSEWSEVHRILFRMRF